MTGVQTCALPISKCYFELPDVSIVLYAMNINHGLSPKEKLMLTDFLKHIYPKLFIIHRGLDVKSIVLKFEESILNEWVGDTYYKSAMNPLKIADIKKKLDKGKYNNYIKNFVKENY